MSELFSKLKDRYDLLMSKNLLPPNQCKNGCRDMMLIEDELGNIKYNCPICGYNYSLDNTMKTFIENTTWI